MQQRIDTSDGGDQHGARRVAPDRRASPSQISSDTLLSSLAILRINWDERGHTYIDNFLPFAADCMLALGGTEFTAEQLQRSIAERFKIHVPATVVASVLKRAVREGLGRRHYGALHVDRAKLEKYDLTAKRDRVLRQQRNLVAKLQTFARDHEGMDLSPEQAETALLGHVDEHAVSLLEAARNGQPYQPSLGLERSVDYVVSRFILELLDRDPQGFEYLESIVQGSMLASALYLPQVAEAGRRFTRTTLYLDTPIVLRALGYEGSQARESAREMMDSAYALGASLACFESTLVETRGVLQAAAASIRRPRTTSSSRRPVEQYFLENGFGPSDVELLIQRLEEDLTSLRVEVKERPEHVRELTVDEQELERQLREEAGYQQDNALKHDLDAITAIHRLRRGEAQLHLETCRALFVTTNAPLVRVARTFFDLDTRSAWPLAMLDHDVGTLIWLKRPAAVPDLPRKQLIADCYAALQPPPSVWTKYLGEIAELREKGTINESDYSILRYSNVASQALMEQTRGDVKRVTRQTIDHVLQKASEEIQQPVVERMRELQAHDEAVGAQHEAAVQRAERAEAALESSERARHSTEEKLEKLVAGMRSAARRRAVAWGRRIRSALTLALLAMTVVSAWLALPSGIGLSPDLGTTWPWVARVVLMAGIMISVVAVFYGGSILTWANSVEVTVSRYLERRILESRGLNNTVSSVRNDPLSIDEEGRS